MRYNYSIKNVSVEREVHKCDMCEYKTIDKNNLLRHNQAVHEKQIYHCNYCQHKSTRADRLKTHIDSIHLGIRYNCKECYHEATTKLKLKKHINSLHRGELYQCPYCFHRTKYKNRIKEHIYSSHRGRKILFLKKHFDEIDVEILVSDDNLKGKGKREQYFEDDHSKDETKIEVKMAP